MSLTEASATGYQVHKVFCDEVSNTGGRTGGVGGDLFLLELLDLFFTQAGDLDDELHVGSGGLEAFDCLRYAFFPGLFQL